LALVYKNLYKFKPDIALPVIKLAPSGGGVGAQTRPKNNLSKLVIIDDEEKYINTGT